MKQYILKPGKHQFAPGSPAIYDNDNLSDEEAKWYLEKYPHIQSLFESLPANNKPIKAKRKRISVKNRADCPLLRHHYKYLSTNK